jgi:hypothetical protein
MKRSPAPEDVHQGCAQRNKYRFHTGNATWAPTEKSTKSMSTVFLVGTGGFDFLPHVYRDTNLSKSSISFRVSDHYPLWTEFKLYLPWVLLLAVGLDEHLVDIDRVAITSVVSFLPA